jgi:hypothetical protein
LSKLKDVDNDNDKSTNGSTQGVQLQSNEAKTIETFARENAILRQQQYHNSQIRPRSSRTNAYNLGNGYGVQEPVPEKPGWWEEVLPLKTAVEASRLLSRCLGCCRGAWRPLPRCQRRRRSVKAPVEVSKPPSRCSRLLPKCLPRCETAVEAFKAAADVSSVECVPAKDVKVNELGVWLPGRLLNVSLVMCKRIEACLPLILLFVESVR